MSIILGFLVAAAGAGAVAVLCAMHGTPGISVGTVRKRHTLLCKFLTEPPLAGWYTSPFCSQTFKNSVI